MHSRSAYYDVAIIGAGLAGLSAAIRLAQMNFRVALLEKERFPFHKVCGEYISLESLDLLRSLQVPLDEWSLPRMDTLQLSSPDGNLLQQTLPLGGFGVSRYLIDSEMARIASAAGVDVFEGTKVQQVEFDAEKFTISSDHQSLEARVCCGAFGKRSNLDVKWKRPFVSKKADGLNNYIGVKYHARLDHPGNVIALHNFRSGYCGIAAIEEGKVNICYLTTAANLRAHGNDLQQMERAILFANPFLRRAFSEAQFLFDKPLTISQISFEQKEQLHHHILFMGDAAGMITPLCGNGMSMALHGSTIAVQLIKDFLRGAISRESLEAQYQSRWQKTFGRRLRTGRIIQHIFGKPWLTNAVVRTLKPFPSVVRGIVRRTHG